MEESAKKSKKKLVIILISIGAALILAVAAYFIVTDINLRNEQEAERLSVVESDTFLEGVAVNGIGIGGLTMEEAQKKLEGAQADMLKDATFRLTYDTTTATVTPEELGMHIDFQPALEEAFGLARDGDYNSVMQIVNETRENGRNFEAPMAYDEASLDQLVSKLAGQIDQPAVSAELALSEDKTEMEYTEEQKGLAVDKAKLKELLQQKLADGDYSDAQIPVNVTEPEVTAEELAQSITKRSHASTSFASGSNDRDTRVYNIKKASGLINGVIVKPGETFSMNDTLGPRTYALGWKPAPAIIEGGAKTEDQAGGGVCQVSSTLYNAVLMADLEIVDRRPHSRKLGYVGGGLDATINTGTIDFKWKNNTEHDIVIMSWVEGKEIFVEIYGESFGDEFDEIRLSSEQVRTIYPSGDVEVEVDETKKPGYKETYSSRRNGSEWKSYKHYYKDGKKVRTEFVATSKYKAVRGKIIVGPEEEEATAPAVTATPGATKTPTVTKAPEPTKAPEVTKAPEPTKTPEATKAPEPTKAPEATKAPEEPQEPAPEGGGEVAA